VGIPHVKRVYNRLKLVLVVDLHGTVDIKLALNEVLIEDLGNILPLRGCNPWGYQPNQESVLGSALDFGFCCQQLAVVNE
jgi:hypothetical protein